MQHRVRKILDGRNVRNVGRATHAGRHNVMLGMKRADGAISAPKLRAPRLRRLIVNGAVEQGAGPEVDLHGLHISFQPAGDLVLGNVVRPGRRKRHVPEMVHGSLVVKLEAVVAKAPIVSDAFLFVDDEGVKANSLQLDGGGDACMSASHYEKIRLAVCERKFRPALFKPVRLGKISLYSANRTLV